MQRQLMDKYPVEGQALISLCRGLVGDAEAHLAQAFAVFMLDRHPQGGYLTDVDRSEVKADDQRRYHRRRVRVRAKPLETALKDGQQPISMNSGGAQGCKGDRRDGLTLRGRGDVTLAPGRAA